MNFNELKQLSGLILMLEETSKAIQYSSCS